ncbi:serine/threonine-protein kinase [Streptomyces sp. AM8-1-1]|uniref:serine/threonine-protein kinase n=1 Tax=Streptomyces sp. AM8-1-1 TaxID=3075825 RepID=UPI0028C3F0A8|nr:serine/threonine-protein kinase [Streptomyces sp. AM8-1-1]WNO73089.1 serine/threonine-protein kinase [Streptomyces sp. AM8-1-1]
MLDRYELRTQLGQGSMGQVWQAWDTQLKRPTAVKIINPDLLIKQANAISHEDLAARFCREAELGARFSHPGLPTLYDAHLDGSPKDLYMVWELVLGQDLTEILTQEGGRLPVVRALFLAAQIADVLACAHEDPVIHRDLKPANIMITEAWKVKLLDFGVAAIFGADHPRLTQPGQILGTVAYMAPEQFTDRGLIVPQTDIYALGCLLYEMLTGQPPFTGDHATVMDSHRHRPPAPVRELRPDVPPGIGDLVMSMLAKDSADRPASAQLIADQLAPHHAASGPSTDAGTTATEPPASPVPLHIRIVQAQALFDAGRFGDALPAYNKLSAELAAEGDEHADEAAEARAKAAFCHLRLGNRKEALSEYEALVLQLSQRSPTDSMLLLDVHSNLGLLQEAAHQPGLALATLADAYPLLVEHLGRDAPLTTEVRAALNRLQLGSSFPRQEPAITPQLRA